MYQKIFFSFVFTLILFSFPERIFSQYSVYKMDIAEKGKSSVVHTFSLGTDRNPAGDVIQINSNNLLFNGIPQLPVMGEIHYSRFKDSEWKKELLKMRAGGVTVIATYVFWIHHEEAEGDFNWEGQRNLRKFLQICKELNYPVVLRIGPWCHGEVRNGGFPEWLVKSGIKMRENNPDYLEKVQNWYSEIFRQAGGFMWKDGGPVIGIQIENEYRGRGTHLMTLKKMAVDLGFDVPLYTRTGWPKLNTPVPYGEIIPLYGDYADGFWDRTLDEMPGDYSKSFIFRSFRNSTVIATEQLPVQSGEDNPTDLGYPYFTCELGGGMMTSYHRRINIAPMDVYSMTLIRVGSGSNLPGYYMYHGGNNPDGRLTTLNEHQATSMTNHNDLPVETYDFQAPLGEFGQINPHYHLLRKLHIFLKDFGNELAMMKPQFPEISETDARRDSLVRWAVRSNGKSGFIFVNNYQRLKKLSPKSNVQFSINLPDEKLLIPQNPVTIPGDAGFFLPFHLALNGAHLVYSTTQLVAKMEEPGNSTYIFSQIEGIPSEFVFSNSNISVVSASGNQKTEGNQIYFSHLKTGTTPAIQLRTSDNKKISILLLDEKTSLRLWKGEFAGKERIFISNSDLTFDGNLLELNRTERDFEVSIFPAPKSLIHNGRSVKSLKDGIFSKYKIKLLENKAIKVGLTKTKDFELPLRVVSLGARNVAEMPQDKDFEKAAEWKIAIPGHFSRSRNITLRIRYKGDVARVYSGNKLLTDNFYNGKPMDVNLRYFADEMTGNVLILNILPLQKNTPAYFQREAGITFDKADYMLEEPVIEIIEGRTVTFIGK